MTFPGTWPGPWITQRWPSPKKIEGLFDLFLGTRVLRELFGVFLWSKSAIPHRFRMEVVWLAILHGSITKAVMCIGDLLRGRKGDPVGTIEAVTNEYD